MHDTTGLPDRRLFIILPSAFLVSLAVGLIGLGMLFILKESYGATPVTVAWFAALSSLAYFVGCVAFRPLAHRVRASDSMAFMNIASAILLAGHLLFRGLASAFIVYGLIGLFTALFWPRLMGWLTSGIEGPALSRASGAFSVSWSAGAAIAPYLAGLMAERGLFVPVYAATVVFAVNGIFIAFGRKIAAAPPQNAVPPKNPRMLFLKRRPRLATGARGDDRSTPLRYPAWIGVFLIYAFVAVFLNIFPLYGRDVLGFSEAVIGFILLVRAASMSLGFWIFSRLTFWHFRPILIPATLFSGLVVNLVFVSVRSPLGFCLGLTAAGFVQAALYGGSIFYGASGAPDRDSRVTVHESMLTVGQILGTLIAGATYQLFSWPLVFIGIGALMALGVIGQMALIRRR
ncbi:MAG: MFS transporter [Rectinemataceae bacterium]